MILPKDGEILHYPQFFNATECEIYFQSLKTQINWKHEPIKLFGKEIMQPRLTAWYGDTKYTYSGITMNPKPWTEHLQEIKKKIEQTAKVTFTSALLNQYRDEHDSVGWHRDNEKELGKFPVIGSVSFGATRVFKLKHRLEKNLKASVELTDGSFLLMRGETQHYWQHCIPKLTIPTGPRINLTFRIL
ncbi:MAG: alpha-ketoglutarate-dependent dioxygenase AlkB [Bdellovibrionales bacterium]|nr:alpha-ketoglutarate-dependent dioxygenase AlkB [Bdellovibrionales bacterium]